ncbi:MAG TPA: ABC transporter substrate-binding protein, partial [Polyangiaceae bacterium]|nr:ABC transporter substrate-binding protein [Polyangiaceae bacterium]
MKPTSASAHAPAPSCSRARALVALLVGLVVALLSAPAGAADGLARVKKAGVLRWGGDVQGGEPFVHEDAKGHRVGFEVELAEGLARRLGARAEFVQNDWSALIPSLERGTFDVILNGFELTRSRASRVLYTRPYKMFASRLTVRAARPLEGTRAALKGKRIGSLAGTRSFEIVREARGEPVSYEGCLEPYIDLEQGRIDGVLLDDLIADRYARGRQGLVVAGDLETGAYAVATRRDEATLRDAVDAALADMIRDGELRAILSRAKLLDARDEVIFTWSADDQARALTGVFPRPAPVAGGGDAGDAGAGDAGGPDAG